MESFQAQLKTGIATRDRRLLANDGSNLWAIHLGLWIRRQRRQLEGNKKDEEGPVSSRNPGHSHKYGREAEHPREHRRSNSANLCRLGAPKSGWEDKSHEAQGQEGKRGGG